MARPGARLSVAEILNPASVAVVGASDDLKKFGARVFNNTLHGGFRGRAVPINPNRATVLGVPAVASIADLDVAVEVVAIAVPRQLVQATVEQCAERGVGCCIVITAGYGEVDAEGARLEAALVEIAGATGMRLIGPNCLGLINTHHRLLMNSSPSMEETPLRAGGIAFITQSGALMATVYNRGVADGAAFSTAVSVGNQADLELCDFIEHLADDPQTRVITLYVEGFKDPQRFLRAVEQCRRARKPVLMVKAGLSESGSRVTRSHTASLASAPEVLRAVCREAGVILVDDILGMIQAAELFARFGHPEGDGVCVLSGSGGAAAIVADRMAERGLRLAEFGPRTRAQLKVLYEPTQLGNPIDIGALREKSFTNVDDGGLSIAAADPDVSAMLLPITTGPQLTATTRRLAESAAASRKPALFTFMPGNAADGARTAARQAGVLCYETLDETLRALTLWIKSRSAPSRDSAPPERPTDLPSGNPLARLPTGYLVESEVKRLVAHYGLAVTNDALATDVDAALDAARRIGYPVVLKAVSRALTHKSDAGGVRLGIESDSELRDAWRRLHEDVRLALDGCLVCETAVGGAEMILGIKRDREFGPMVLFGFGGTTTELLGDFQMSPAPLSPARVREQLRSLRLAPVLDGFRGPSLDVAALCDAVSRLGWLAVDAPQLGELDLNPVMVRADGGGIQVADARAFVTAG